MSDETIPQMRETIERLSKDKAGLSKQVEDQAKQLRVYEAKDAFRAAGFNPNHGTLFAAVNPEGEITQEAVVAFADEQGFVPVASTQESNEEAGGSTSEAVEEQANLAALSGGGSRAGQGGAGGAQTETLTREAWRELHRRDPAAAQAAIASGRVEIARDNPYVRNQGLPRGENPYATLTESA